MKKAALSGEEINRDAIKEGEAKIRENYMAGGGSSLELLFSSTDLSSFLARKELVDRVSERDTKLITELTSDLVELNSLETQLESEKLELQGKRDKLDSDMSTLTARQDDLQSSMDVQEAKKKEATKKYEQVEDILEQLDEDSEEYKAIIKRQEEERKIIEAQIDAYIKEHGSPIDFFSWHTYGGVDIVPIEADFVDNVLNEYGYGHIETHLNEWNLSHSRKINCSNSYAGHQYQFLQIHTG